MGLKIFYPLRALAVAEVVVSCSTAYRGPLG